MLFSKNKLHVVNTIFMLLLSISSRVLMSSIKSSHNAKFQLIRSYFAWRNVNSIIILDEIIDKQFAKEFSMETSNFVSFQTISTFVVQRHKCGIVLFFNDNFMNCTDLQLFQTTFRLDNLIWLILVGDGRKIEDFPGTAAMRLNVDVAVVIETTDKIKFSFVQIYKIIKDDANSLIKTRIGIWDSTNQTRNFLPFLPAEKRTNFHRFPLKFGKKNATKNQPSENIIEDDSDEEKLIEFANYFQLFLNASAQMFYFPKLGHKEVNGEWTDLLRAVIDEKVDLGLDRIIKTPERNTDLSFTHEILKSMRNIYVKPQPSNELRDIFLVPFSAKLILCVSSTALILSILMAIVNKVSGRVTAMQDAHSDEGFMDTIISCIGILSMQGSAWLPSTYSGNIILITSLAFAELIFNSYSAFITSILSVEIVNIGSLDQLLASSYNIGYAKNGQDEIYLRFMNDTQLQQIYLRGYLENTVTNITEGLLKSTRGHYAFFASGNIARKELQTINNYRCNLEIIEISIPKTKNTIAFPLSKDSPYRKVINLSLLKMYETGVYKYMHSIIVPDFPKCTKSRVFRGAQLSDLMTAFAILTCGMVLSIIILWLECLWKNKMRIYRSFNKTVHEKLHFGHHDH